MSTSLEATIRTHLQANDAAQETIDWAEIVSRLETELSPAPVPRRSKRFGVWVAVTAAVLTILLIGLIPLLIESDNPSPADTVVPTTVAEPVPVPDVDVSGLVWTVATVEGVFRGAMVDVVFGDDGFVAVGSHSSGDGRRGAVWYSVGGDHWSRVDADQLFPVGSRIEAVGYGGGDYVAVGRSGVYAAAWWSDDGRSWARITDFPYGSAESASANGRVVASGVAWIDGRWVAVGAHSGQPPGVIWTSDDGVTWSLLDQVTTFGSAAFRGVAAGSDRFVAVATADPVVDALAWWSDDGLAWNRSVMPSGYPQSTEAGITDSLLTVEFTGAEFVAFGDLFEAGNQQVSWHSADGITWVQRNHDEVDIASLASAGAGLVLSGTDPDTNTAKIWWSTDGISMTEYPELRGLFSHQFQYPGSVAYGEGVFVFVGFEQDEDQVTTAVAAFGRQPTTTSTHSGDTG